MIDNAAMLREHFRMISFKADLLSIQFYDHLFMRYPQLRSLFDRVRMDEQRRKIVHSMAVILRNAENPRFLEPYLKGLGLSHIAYGAQLNDYDAVHECLLAALKEVSGELWNDQLEAAWSEAFVVVARIMQQGAALAGEARKQAA